MECLDCVLSMQRNFKESKYGAYVLDGQWLAPQPADVLAYTIIQNSTSTHAPAIFANVRLHALRPVCSGQCCVKAIEVARSNCCSILDCCSS